MKRSFFRISVAACGKSLAPVLLGVVLLVWGGSQAVAAATDDIRAAVLGQAASTPYHPLPLAAVWNVGEMQDGFTPDYQIELIRRGHRILPSFHLPSPIGRPPSWFYYQKSFAFLAEHNLPFCLLGTQWEHVLTDMPQFFRAPVEVNGNVVTASGKVLPKVSAFGPAGAWSQAGKVWTDRGLVEKLQQVYPDPPRVLFVSNNEHKTMKVGGLSEDRRYVAQYGDRLTAVEQRRLLGDAWISRYRRLQQGMRDGLQNQQWKLNARFIGYNAFLSPEIGRSAGWVDTSLQIPERLQPWPFAWDGASISYYARPYDDSSDHTWWSPQIQSMNFPFMLVQAMVDNPDFWFEMSVWDGGVEQRGQYVEAGQVYDPQRYQGMVRFGAWLLRPRVVREFRFWNEKVAAEGTYFDALLQAVDEVHDKPLLRHFWQQGRLLPNSTQRHPYSHRIPDEYRDEARWFLLDTEPGPDRRGWFEPTGNIPVFALALELGKAPRREWLVFAHSPLKHRPQVVIQLPGFGEMRADVPVEGRFLHVRESDRRIEIAP